MGPSLNIYIASIGRPSLAKMLASLTPQLTSVDKVTFLLDGTRYRRRTLKLINEWNVPAEIQIHMEDEPLGYWGHGIRNKYQGLDMTKDYVMHADDDDVYLPGALDKIRRACYQDALYLFRFKNSKGSLERIFWHTEGGGFEGNVGTPCGVFPPLLSYPKWELRYGGDGAFYEGVSKVLPVVWKQDLIYHAF